MTAELDAGVLKLVKALTAERERAEKAEADADGQYQYAGKLLEQTHQLETRLHEAEAALARVRNILAEIATADDNGVCDSGYSVKHIVNNFFAAAKGANHE